MYKEGFETPCTPELERDTWWAVRYLPPQHAIITEKPFKKKAT
ncbi:hypothetical protein SAMN05443144_12175 [Fodinibius roseus]|uniref:Uncharacterized protein n=1 Tax=Fodinibius roseus TaxID=1194090 RepID=A0A1M5HYM6_9BACT|nr:hypothetical protein [Fodinibius roseus]SHG21126.1 hypothetical protein SAMN05443144_12175 [Fodinibius roseus]